jgi:two-component system, cell cycle sensor histidine kinase and response regulator CckA
MVMPGIGGEEVYQQIKEMRPNVRVLISSGFDPGGRMIEVLNRYCEGFLCKPFTLGELSEKVQELLRKG